MQAVMKAFKIRIQSRDFGQKIRVDRGFFREFSQRGLGFGFARFYAPAGNGPFAFAWSCAALDQQESMCGRFTLAGDLDQIATRFAAKISDNGLWDWQPRYNVAPGAVIPTVAFNGQKERAVVPMRWGLHPSWRKEPPEGRPLFNARVETAKEKPSFRTPYKRRRALIR